MERLFTVKELSDIINVRESTIYAWVSQERIPHIKLGKKVLFDPSEIEKWVKEHRRSPAKYN